MTNIFKTAKKVERKGRLFEIGLQTLEEAGWTVSRAPGMGKASVRRITKDGASHLVSIRTTQDQWIAFPPKPEDKGWITLDEVDVVLAVSVDANDPPKEALVHWFDAKDMQKRFDRALAARRKEGRVQPERRGVWIPLYVREGESENVSYVGGGAGLDHPPIARVPMQGTAMPPNGPPPVTTAPDVDETAEGLTIAAAKRGLALRFGVPESSIKIMVEA